MKTHFDLILSKKIVYFLMIASVVLAMCVSPTFGQDLEDPAQVVKQVRSDDCSDNICIEALTTCQEYRVLKIDPVQLLSTFDP